MAPIIGTQISITPFMWRSFFNGLKQWRGTVYLHATRTLYAGAPYLLFLRSYTFARISVFRLTIFPVLFCWQKFKLPHLLHNKLTTETLKWKSKSHSLNYSWSHDATKGLLHLVCLCPNIHSLYLLLYRALEGLSGITAALSWTVNVCGLFWWQNNARRKALCKNCMRMRGWGW